MASTTTSSKPSISRGRRWKAASVPIGDFLTHRMQPKFAWTGPITDPDYIKQAGLAVLLGVLLSLPILAIAGVTVTQAAMLAVSANLVGAWFTAIVAFWKGHYFVPGAAFALGSRALAADALDRDRAVAARRDRGHCLRPAAAPTRQCAVDRSGRLRTAPATWLRKPMSTRRKYRSTFRPAASRRIC